MNEDTLFNLIGRLYYDLRLAGARIQQLQRELEAQKSAPPPPDAQAQQ